MENFKGCEIIVQKLFKGCEIPFVIEFSMSGLQFKILNLDQKKAYSNFEMHFGPLNENNMKNVQKIGTSIPPKIYEKFSFLKKI